MNDRQFRSLLDLYMVSDPWPLTATDDENIRVALNGEATERGFSSWADACHNFEPSSNDSMEEH